MPSPRFRRHFAWLPLLFFLITALALIIGAIVLHYVEADLVARSGETLALAAVDIADKLDRVLFERYGDIQVLAETPVLQGSDPEAMATYLTLVQRTNPTYVWIGVVDATGRIVAATDPTSVGQDRSDRSWFQVVRDDLSVHVQDAQPSEDAGGAIAVGFTAPLRGKGGEFLGTVTTRVELQVLEDVFARTVYALELQREVSSGIEWQFLNRDGDIILDSLLRQEMKMNLKRLGLPSAVLSLEGEPGYVQERHLRRKVPVITGYAKTGGYGRFTGLQWGVLVRMDRSNVLAPIRAILWKLGLAGAVIWAPLFGLLLWSVWRLRVEWAHAQESEATLRESENRFRSVFEETAIGMVLLEPNGRFLRVNRAFCAMVGYAEDELLTKTFQAITHPDDLDRNIKDVEKLLAGETLSIHIEKRYRHKLGQTICVHVNVSLVRDARGAPRYFIAQSQDITERKQAEEQLRQSEERFRKMFDDAPIGMATVGLDYRFIRVNKTLCNMLGYTDHELIGRTFADITYPEDIKEDVRLAEQLFRGDIPSYQLEKRYEKKNGDLLWIHLTASVMRDQDGKVLYGLGMIEDITERRQIERQLRQSEKMASLGLLLDGVAHELNNPLFMISGFTQLADEKVKKGQYDTLAADLASIREAVDRSTEIIQRTLTVARRAKAGGEPCQVNNVVQQTLDLVAHGLAGDKIALRKNFQADLPSVLANPRELSQVFMNLIDNARRAMASAQGRGTLTATTALVPGQPKPWVELRVTDDGPGVAPALQTRIFEPFSTAQQGSKGTGLSLAFCHRIVTELGGTLTLESKVGQGATFIVRLPALEAMAP